MKFEIQIFVVRLNKEVVDIYPLNDEGYDDIQICLDAQYLSDEDILNFYNHMSDEYANKRLEEIRESGRLFEEQEAKDLYNNLSQYSMKIEKHSVEIN
jgi:hypothetical protein